MKILDQSLPGTVVLDTELDPTLFTLSLLAAVVSAYVALLIADRLRQDDRRAMRLVWLAVGGIVLGGGAWTCHFIGTLAVRMQVPVTFEEQITLASLWVGFITGTVVMFILVLPSVRQWSSLAAGLLLSGGVLGIHYIGLQGQNSPAAHYVELNALLMATALSVALPCVALLARYQVLKNIFVENSFWEPMASALILGSAIAGVHYVSSDVIMYLVPSSMQATATEFLPVRTQMALVVWVFAIVTVVFIFTYLLADRQADSYRRLAAETELRLQAQTEVRNLSQAVEQSPVPILMANVDGTINYVNRSFVGLTGIKPSSIIGKRPEKFRLERARGNLGTLADVLDQGERWTGGVMVEDSTGGTHWWRTTLALIKGDEEDAGQFMIMAEDVTEMRDKDRQLELAATVFNASAEALMVTDGKNVIVSVNPSFTDITGYRSDEVLGKTPAILNSGRHDDAFFDLMYGELQVKGKWTGEIWNKRKDGAIIPNGMTITAVTHDGRAISNYIAAFSDISDRKEAEETIIRQANFDGLTGLPNRNLFHDRLRRALGAARRNETKVALMFIDLDRFKNVNDTYGHSAGDMLIIEMGKRIQKCLRAVDTVARMGGDEFVVILTDLQVSENARIVAEKILESLNQPFSLGHAESHNSGSVGIALYPDDAEDEESLIRNADTAMFAAKEAGRNNYHFFTEEMNQRIVASVKLESDLRTAVQEDQFSLVYQPMVNLTDTRVVGAEALARWVHPEQGLIPPSEFIPVAEETGLIVDLGTWVINHACAQIRRWKETSNREVAVSVNVSARQFMEAEMFDRVCQILEKHDVPPHLLQLEITESLFLDTRRDSKSMDILFKFHNHGVTMIMDDFGTGYSSMSYLKQLPVSGIKIDSSFITNINENNEDEAMVRAMVSMAESLGLSVIAEGVESLDQEDMLREIGCPLVQGYLYSRPVDGESFLGLFDRLESPMAAVLP